MLSRFQFFLFISVVIFVSSCAVVEEKQPDSQTVLETDSHFAWRLSEDENRAASSNRAVRLLLSQADALMNEANFEQAGDKLQRLVRIEPTFAQAWSRLSWMALKNGEAKRSQQLAQRSNSYSRGIINLKILNWHFIQKAGELLNDVDIVQQAQQMIKKLGND